MCVSWEIRGRTASPAVVLYPDMKPTEYAATALPLLKASTQQEVTRRCGRLMALIVETTPVKVTDYFYVTEMRKEVILQQDFL